MPTVAPSETSPNIGNYYIGRGFIELQLEGENAYKDCGNCTMFEYQVKPTLLDHYSSRVGVRFKDFVAVTELAATLTMSLEEYTARNMAIAMLGSVSGSPGNLSVDMFSTPLIYAALRFTPSNVVGPKWSCEFPLTILSPNKAMSLISAGSGAWGTIDLQADVLKDPHTGQFGIITNTDIGA